MEEWALLLLVGFMIFLGVLMGAFSRSSGLTQFMAK